MLRALILVGSRWSKKSRSKRTALFLAGALLATAIGMATLFAKADAPAAARVAVPQYAAHEIVLSSPTSFAKTGAPAAPQVSVPRYSSHEIVLYSSTGFDNAYTDVAVTGEFTGPDGQTVTVPGFWDGEETFRVRFTPTITGTWTYSIASDPVDVGLVRNGRIEVTEPMTENHGFLRNDSSNPGSFVYDDGARYFMWGQTYYEIVRSAIAGDEWKTAIDQSQASGINKVRMLVYPWGASENPHPDSQPFASDTDHDHLNLVHWQKLDEIIRHLDSRGMIAELVLFADAYRAFGSQAQDERYVRYILARYAAYHNVTWVLTNEWNYTGKPQSYWDGLGSVLKNEDPWMTQGPLFRPLSIHQQTRLDFQFFDSSWPTYAVVQFGIRNRTYPNGDQWGNASITANSGRGVPVVNDEYGYFGEVSRTDHRNAIWGIATAGGYGSAGDIRLVDGMYPIFCSNWHDAPGYYTDISNMIRFFTNWGIEYWKMSGQNDLVTSGTRVYLLGNASLGYVAYAAAGGAFSLSLPAANYNVRWYHPATGAMTDAPSIAGGSHSFAPPFSGDAVLYLADTSASPAPSPVPTGAAAAAPPPTPVPRLASAPAPTPTPGPLLASTPAPTQVPGASPAAVTTPTPAATPTNTRTPTPAPTSTNTRTPAPTSTPAPRSTPTHTPTPTFAQTPAIMRTLTPAPIASPEQPPTVTPSPTETLSPTSTPTATPAPAPTSTPTPPEQPPSAPRNLKASPEKDRSVELTWSRPESSGKVHISGYRVYRGTSPDDAALVAKLDAKSKFEDRSVDKDITYYYRVTAFNDAGESPPSNQVSWTAR